MRIKEGWYKYDEPDFNIIASGMSDQDWPAVSNYDEELGWIIDAMGKNLNTEKVHIAADRILLELLRESHPKTVEAFERLEK